MDVLIDNRQDKIDIEVDIEEIVQKVCKECLIYENKSLNYEISISFVDNKEIKRLNGIYRGKDKPTDVLSFPMEDDDDTNNFEEKILLGDIVISAEKAMEQSKEYGHSFIREVAYLTAHSMFHLMGYDHMTEKEKQIMRQKEKDIMKKIKIFKNN
ncbi:rRNA maturation RNase YbeY [Caldisalinibacter kiritimatiensis]|uniref:Endoribonuclease YbeY n=1 Tax=Caldisalinibacter kiritimatiensis TaxID=1304284 RepID=R1AYU2_9FIRM|nr:rRNA maturation RNase YbeY [Caldisalinibacter kiritimatiensis]EOD01877.1 Metal-dependent hydrolase [Caldisalinibacter kiritimatiensis]